ncbi:Sar s 1 allergen (cysteine protease-like protein 8), partial [Sarcoptes scabiei]
MKTKTKKKRYEILQREIRSESKETNKLIENEFASNKLNNHLPGDDDSIRSITYGRRTGWLEFLFFEFFLNFFFNHLFDIYDEILNFDYRKCRKDFAQFRRSRYFRFCNLPPHTKLPKEFDLRKLKVIPPVRNQKRCNASWAFGPLGAVESALIHRFHLPHRHFQLSTQELVDCAGNQGCRGGVDV